MIHNSSRGSFEPAIFLVNYSVINVRGMHLTGVSRNTINVGIATTVSSFSALMMLSTGTVMFPKDVIKSPGKDKEISADHERRNV
jgi:hypothetical protein